MVVKDKEEGGGVWNEATDGTGTRNFVLSTGVGRNGGQGGPTTRRHGTKGGRHVGLGDLHVSGARVSVVTRNRGFFFFFFFFSSEVKN